MQNSNDLISLTAAWVAEQAASAFAYLSGREALIQACAIIASLLAAKILTLPLHTAIQRRSQHSHSKWFRWLAVRFNPVTFPLCALMVLTVVIFGLESQGIKAPIMWVISNLFAVWVAIRLTSSFVEDTSLARWIAILAWSIAALNILGLLQPVVEQLDAIRLPVSTSDISVYEALKSIFAFGVFLWTANVVARISERRISRLTSLTPSLKVLIVKLTRTILILLAFIIALDTLGIDLTSLAIFSGALGVGIGFGMQRVVSNFVSGIILLLDRSIKPGDVIYIGDTNTYGWVNRLGARCVSVVTRDGKEHLIPNELLITEKVENWSYSNRDVRLHIPVGISYQNDLRKALKLMVDVANANPRVLKTRPPSALVKTFSESTVELELRVWINDPINGVANISSTLMLDIWDAFHAGGVQFSYPQREIYIKDGSAIEVRMQNSGS